MNSDLDVLGEQASRYILNFAVWDLARGGLLLFLAFYIVFALLVIRQINLLNSVVGTHLSPFFRMVALLHVFLAVGVFVCALLIL